jgi:hypothetical protein
MNNATWLEWLVLSDLILWAAAVVVFVVVYSFVAVVL